MFFTIMFILSVSCLLLASIYMFSELVVTGDLLEKILGIVALLIFVSIAGIVAQ